MKKIIKISILLIAFVAIMLLLFPDNQIRDKETIRFKRNCMNQYEYIEDMEFILNESGVEISVMIEDISAKKTKNVVDEIQKLVTSKKYAEYIGERYRDKYKNIVASSPKPEEYLPIINVVLYDLSDTLIPRYTYIVSPPYLNWCEVKGRDGL